MPTGRLCCVIRPSSFSKIDSSLIMSDVAIPYRIGVYTTLFGAVLVQFWCTPVVHQHYANEVAAPNIHQKILAKMLLTPKVHHLMLVPRLTAPKLHHKVMRMYGYENNCTKSAPHNSEDFITAPKLHHLLCAHVLQTAKVGVTSIGSKFQMQ